MQLLARCYWCLQVSAYSKMNDISLTRCSDWKWPDIKGLHSFKGDLIHTAKWAEKFDHKSKRVAVIGNGASGVQIVPVLQTGEFTPKKFPYRLDS